MQVLEWCRKRPVLAASLAGLVLGTIIGLARPIHARAPDPAALAEWTPYDEGTIQRYDPAQFAQVRDAPQWVGSAPVGTPGAVQWRLAGIMIDPSPTALVYAKGNQETLRLQVGDALPDGGKVVRISAHGVTFTRAGCEFERALYSAIDQPADEGCSP